MTITTTFQRRHCAYYDNANSPDNSPIALNRRINKTSNKTGNKTSTTLSLLPLFHCRQDVFFIALWLMLLLVFWQTPSFAENSQSTVCRYYAQDAVTAQQQNLKQHCGLTGKRWSTNLQGHQAWCLQANNAQRQAETKARQQALASCLTNKLDRNHADNQLRLPSACKDPRGLFKPQRWVVAWNGNQKQRYSPIKQGVISYDFNQDQRNDYLFLEQDAQHNVQITTCLSANNYPQAGGFERILTDIQFYSHATFPADTRYYLQLKQDLLLVDIAFFAHNEGSCNTKASYRYVPLKQGFDVIDSTAFCVPQTIPGSQEPYPLAPPAIPKMIR